LTAYPIVPQEDVGEEEEKDHDRQNGSYDRGDTSTGLRELLYHEYHQSDGVINVPSKADPRLVTSLIL